ncbi:MAG: 3-isopropylmalate dehydratase [Candidatus Thermoplasmatota archaeon]|nr:3-isopropylmalate dehydratase [Candidatus Thermoplasmatota archaeon]MDA8142976.1 3-isopropylmalate dehydratase [Thermoplasmatales archaeon]
MNKVLKGKVWAFGDNINTDLMYPHACYTLPEEERPLHTMWANRPGWAQQVNSGDILVAGKNFGVGSSRPAASNLKGLGISVVVAESVNGLFLRNSVNVGLPVVSCQGVSGIVREGDTVTVNLETGTLIDETSGKTAEFRPLPGFLMDIIEAGGIIEVLRKNGYIDSNPL